ncbi:MAG: DUF1189 domain-containing protein, partial [Clostridiaceae bacterium]|nr:DUF1189 domain-containing protein [Clostridiaceae bacterium]
MESSKQGNIFVSFYKSITDFDYYKHFIHQTTGKAFGYLIIVSLFFFFISTLPGIFQYKTVVEEIFQNTEQLPYFEIKDGKLRMDSDTYHVVYENKDIGMIVIIDPVNGYRKSDLSYYPLAILLTETELIQKTVTAYNTIPLESLSMFTLTKENITQRFGKFFLTLIPVLTIYMMVFGLGVKVLACYIVHFISIIYVMIKRINLDRKSIFRVCCHAITLPTVVGTILTILKLNIVFWDYIFILAAFLYSYNAIKKYAGDR